MPTTENTFTSYLQNPKPPNNLGVQIKWSNVCSSRGRQTQLNIINDKTGVREEVKDKKSPLQACMLFFTKTMLDIIVIETNRKIEETMMQLQSMLAADSSSRYGYVRLTNPSEVLALIGITYMRGLLGQAHQGTNAMFYEIFGNPVFSATMSRSRFKFLIAHISFDDHTLRPTRWRHNRFVAFRESFEEFNESCGKFLVPDDYLSLDETLYRMRSQISFKQFNPSKPANYGMLYKSINACRYSFTFSTAVYSGKPKAEPTFYYTPGTSQTVKYLIQNLECHTNLVGRNILYHRLYTLIPMAQWLLERGITSVGTLQSNRKGIPAEIKEIKDRETNSYEVYWERITAY